MRTRNPPLTRQTRLRLHAPAIPRLRGPAHATLAALLVGLLVPVAPAHAQGPSTVRFSEILSDPITGQPEFIELWNTGNASVALAGWKVQDRISTPSTYTFASWTLAPNGRVVVWTGTNATDTPQGPKWRTSTVWNNAGDGAALIDPSGTIVDYIAYGTGGGTPPAAFTQPTLPAPAHGRSLALSNGTWLDAAPSPGTAPNAQGSGITFTVVNVAPTASLDGPASAAPGADVTFNLATSDGNGAADLASWTLAGNGVSLASGTGAPPAAYATQAPQTSGPWTVTLDVTDHGQLTAHAQLAIDVAPVGGLVVVMPAQGSLRFPDLAPGATNVDSLDVVTLRNDGPTPVTPHLDVADFQGSAGTVPAQGALWYGIVGSGTTEWHPYTGPLTAMPDLAPGAHVDVALRLAQVPAPLAAGTYGTTFAVTA